MADSERYLEFMEKESEMSNQERLSFGNISQVSQLMEMVIAKNDPISIESYVMKNISTLFSYAPHLTLQVYLAGLVARQLQYDIVSRLEGLRDREDLPAKAYSVIGSYISMLKENETSSPEASFASDEKIKETVDNINPHNISRIVFYLQIRLQTGTSLDHFIQLLNPFMLAPNKDPIYKLTLVRQLAALGQKYPAKEALTVLIDGAVYPIVFDNSLDEQTDPFLRTVSYYSEELKLTGNLKELMISFAMMYRFLHYNAKHLLNNEADIKSFCCCLIEAYNKNLASVSPSAVFKFDFPASYKEQEGYKEASKFLSVAFTPRFM